MKTEYIKVSFYWSGFSVSRFNLVARTLITQVVLFDGPATDFVRWALEHNVTTF